MNDGILNFLKNNWVIPTTVIMAFGLLLVYKFDISITDYIADKVIERLEADYSPYGPNIQSNDDG